MAKKSLAEAINHCYVYNCWTVLRETENKIQKNGYSIRMVDCRCECGTVKNMQLSNLRSGRSKSCGCKKAAFISASNKARPVKLSITPRRRDNPLYSIWSGMKNRCFNKKSPNYPSYGGRGITVCDRWVNSLEDFCADMGKRPEGNSIDRIDVNGNYEPSNCKWSDSTEQNNNKRNSLKIFYKGERITVSQISVLTGIERKWIYQSLKENNYDLDAVLKLHQEIVKNFKGI